MKRILTALLLITLSCAYGQPNVFTADAAQKDIMDNNYNIRCFLKWMPDSCLKILDPVDVQVYYTWGDHRSFEPYDSIMRNALHVKYGQLWDTLWVDCMMCFMGYYGQYKETRIYDFDGEILDPGTAQRHIDQGKLYYLVYGNPNPDYLPEGYFECEKEIYNGLGLEIKWLGGFDVELAPSYNSYVFNYLDSLNKTTGTEEKARQAMRECWEGWGETK